MPAAIILSGAGRYADPWHQYGDTSAELLTLAHDDGWDVTIAEDIDRTLADGLDGIDLLIVNAGDSDQEPAEDPSLIERGRAQLAIAFERGISVLAIHNAASSLRDYPQFRSALGGQWVTGHSWHPPIFEIHVRLEHDVIVEGLGDFTVADERYTDLLTDKDIEPLASTRDKNREYILAWAHQYGTARVIYSSLGHNTASYASRGHKAFLLRALTWLLPRPVFADS
ncbi:MAG: ThuA domain-containing protein [Propionibacteriaceae bacterium]|nr:ThuA domain-containing protein [Propionibacteriaceae bacterium]